MAGTFRSGRHPVPTALHVLRGTYRTTRHGRDRAGEPRLVPGRPACPDEVQRDPAALAHWERLIAQLETSGVLTTAHGDALALLAQAKADYDRVRAQLVTMNHQQLVVDEIRNKDGQVIRRRVRENPLIRRSERLALLCARLLGEFGLTPITQSKVGNANHANAPSRARKYITPARA